MFFKKLYVSLATGKDALWYSQVKGMAHYGIVKKKFRDEIRINFYVNGWILKMPRT